MYYRLHKTLYGLKQSAYEWNKDLDKELQRLGFIRSRAEPCLYTRRTTDDRGRHTWMYVTTWVDDLICAASTTAMRDEFISDFRFPLSSVDRELSWVLKIRVERKNGLLALDQSAYIEDLASKFNASKVPKYTPMEKGAFLSKRQCPEPGSDEHTEMQDVPYRSLLGGLLYLTGVRGDIAFAVGKLARFASNPARVHWKMLKRVLAYVYTTRHRRLVFGGSADIDDLNPITVYTDADHAGDSDTARSTTGIVIKVFGDTVWTKSKLQTKVSNATGAAELNAIDMAVRKIINFRMILEDMGYYQKTIPFFTDADVVVKMLERGYPSTRTKHLIIPYYTVQEQVASGDISVTHIPGVDNPSDICTKALHRDTHEKHTAALLRDHLWT